MWNKEEKEIRANKYIISNKLEAIIALLYIKKVFKKDIKRLF